MQILKIFFLAALCIFVTQIRADNPNHIIIYIHNDSPDPVACTLAVKASNGGETLDQETVPGRTPFDPEISQQQFSRSVDGAMHVHLICGKVDKNGEMGNIAIIDKPNNNTHYLWKNEKLEETNVPKGKPSRQTITLESENNKNALQK